MSVPNWRPLPLAAALALPFAIPHAASGSDLTELPVITITGGLTPVEASAYGRAHSVVTAEDIERRQLVQVTDVLRALPGVAVSRSGSRGGFTQVRIRGAEGNHTLVLIDGVEAASTEGGEYDFAGLLADDIARVEVLRGPQSSLFGSNAIGGVISITTRRAEKPGTSVDGSVELGDDSTRAASFGVSRKAESGDFRLSVAHRLTGGYDVSNDAGGADDEDENLTVNFVGGFDLTASTRIGATLRHTDRTSDYDQENFGAATVADLVTDAPLANARQEWFGSVFVRNNALQDRLASELHLSGALMDNQNLNNGARTTDTTGERFTIRAKATYALDGRPVDSATQTVTAALEWERETFRANDPALVFDPSQLDKQTRDLVSAVLEYRKRFASGLDLQLGLRHDDNDGFKDATTYSAGLSYLIAPTESRLHASLGTGVKNPTLFEQFGFIPGSFQGNPALTPERSRGWDIGVEQTFAGGDAVVDLTYFQDRLEDKIATNFAVFPFSPYNQPGTAKRRGVELSGQFTLSANLGLSLDYTYLDADNAAGQREVRRPRHEAALGVNYDMGDGRTRLTAGVRHVADNLDTDFTAPSFGSRRVALDDYTVVDLALSHRISPNLELYGRIDNAFDETYYEINGYATQPRTASAGIRGRF